MLNSKIIKIHVGEEINFPEIGISVNLLLFDEYYPGKKYEEFGDKTDLKFLFKQKNKKKEIEYSWFDRTPNEYKHFKVFDFEILILKGSYDFLEKEDESGNWLKIVLIKPRPGIEINYKKIIQYYQKKAFEDNQC